MLRRVTMRGVEVRAPRPPQRKVFSCGRAIADAQKLKLWARPKGVVHDAVGRSGRGRELTMHFVLRSEGYSRSQPL
jgi:hypothetical protein